MGVYKGRQQVCYLSQSEGKDLARRPFRTWGCPRHKGTQGLCSLWAKRTELLRTCWGAAWGCCPGLRPRDKRAGLLRGSCASDGPTGGSRGSELIGDTNSPWGRVPWSQAGLIWGFSSYPQACILYLSLRNVVGRKPPLPPALDLSIASPSLGLGFWYTLFLM